MKKIVAVRVPKKLDSNTFNSLLSHVDEEKKIRISRFKHAMDAYRTLIGDVLVRKMISNTLGLATTDIKIQRNSFGKPYMMPCNSLELDFNISHSGEWVVAILGNSRVGIDIEQVKPISYDIIKYIFTQLETSNFVTKSDYDKKNYFYDIWTLKESYVKALGLGLSTPLNSFTIRYYLNGTIGVEPPAMQLYFKQYEIDPEYKLAACSSSIHLPDRLIIMNVSELL